jgi:WD40 repeat protein
VASCPASDKELKSVLRFYRVDTGEEIRDEAFPRDGLYTSISFSPDGKVIALVNWTGVYLVERGSGKELHNLARDRVGRCIRASLSPDGKVLAAAAGPHIHLWDVSTGKELHERPSSGYPACGSYGGAYSPDGRFFATGEGFDVTFDLWDAATGRHVRVLHAEPGHRYLSRLAFTKDWHTLMLGRQDGTVTFLDVATGKPRQTLSLNEARKPQQGNTRLDAFHICPDGHRVITQEFLYAPKHHVEVCIWEIDPLRLVARENYTVSEERGLAPLGHQAAYITPSGIAIVDAGTPQFQVRIPGDWQAPLVTSSNRRLVAAVRRGPPQGLYEEREVLRIHIWEVATGKEVATFAAGPIEHLALAPDGRTLVTTDARSLQLWDIASGKERHRVNFPDDFFTTPFNRSVEGLYLSPDFRRASTPLGDGTVLVWELPVAPRSTKRLDHQEMRQLWADLAGGDATKAYAAACKMTDAPGSTMAFLRMYLKPAPDVDLKRIRQLIDDLDSDSFSARDAALKELEIAGPAAVPALREALAAHPPPERRRRVESLLDKSKNSVPSGEALRRLRAVQILEDIGSPEARRLLETMAGGAPAAAETREAKTALRRLGP